MIITSITQFRLTHSFRDAFKELYWFTFHTMNASCIPAPILQTWQLHYQEFWNQLWNLCMSKQFEWNLWGRCESTVLFKMKTTNLKILFCSVLKYNRSGISTWCPHDTTTWVGTSTAQIKSFHRRPISRPTGHKIISLGPTVHCFWCLNLIKI
jgi:hypothetical protein